MMMFSTRLIPETAYDLSDVVLIQIFPNAAILPTVIVGVVGVLNVFCPPAVIVPVGVPLANVSVGLAETVRVLFPPDVAEASSKIQKYPVVPLTMALERPVNVNAPATPEATVAN